MKTATTALSYGAPKVLHVNPDWAKLPLFDRSKWQRVRFGDVVENLNEIERDPAGAGVERLIAMEHLEPGSLHIRKWGSVADDTTFNSPRTWSKRRRKPTPRRNATRRKKL